MCITIIIVIPYEIAYQRWFCNLAEIRGCLTNLSAKQAEIMTSITDLSHWFKDAGGDVTETFKEYFESPFDSKSELNSFDSRLSAARAERTGLVGIITYTIGFKILKILGH